MRTADPNACLQGFIQQVGESLDQYRQVEVLLAKASASAAISKAVAEDTAFRLGALWEVFQGRWHVAAISRDPQHFIKDVQDQLDRRVKDDWSRAVIGTLHPGSLTVPSRPKMAQIEAILDPSGYNITFKDSQTWMESSALYHADLFKDRVKGIVSDPEAASLLDLLKKLRNTLAHGSIGSKAAFNRACKSRMGGSREGLVGASNDPLRRDRNDVRDIGAYLRVRRPSPAGPRRVEALHARVQDVAERLRVP